MNFVRSAVHLRRVSVQNTPKSFFAANRQEVYNWKFSSESAAESNDTSRGSSSAGSPKGWRTTAKSWVKKLIYAAGAVVTLGGAYDVIKKVKEEYKRPEPMKILLCTKERYLRREKELTNLEKAFKQVEESWRRENPQAKGSMATVYLTGKPGIGKTQLALGYARNFQPKRWFHRSTFSPNAVAYLDGSNLPSSYPRLLEALKPGSSKKDMTLDQMLASALQGLKEYNSWLLVIDHVNSSDVPLPQPEVTDHGRGRILIVTSNHGVVKSNYATELKLGGMTKNEAVDLLNKTSGLNGNDSEARELVKFLGCVPLSITSAGFYIQKKQSRGNCYSYRAYQKHYSASGFNPDEIAENEGLIDKQLHQSVYDAVAVTLADDKDGTLKKVFTLLACCEDCPVPMTLVARLIGKSPHQDVLHPSLVKVRECVLLDHDSHATPSNQTEDARIQKETITVDSVTRSVLREQLKGSGNSDFLSLLHKIREAFVGVGLDEEKKGTSEWYEIRRNLIPHMESVQKVTMVTRDYSEDPEMSCDYEYVMGMCYAHSVPEKLSKAEEHFKNALKHCPKRPVSERVGDINLELGNIKRRQGLTDESMKFFKHYMESGKDKKKILKAADALSKTYNIRGEFDETEKLFKKYVEEKYSDKELIDLHSQLGVALVWLGEGQRAETYLKKALEYASKRQKLRPMTSLVRVYQLMDKYQDSLHVLDEMNKIYSDSDQPESGGLAIVEGRRSAAHFFLNNRTESMQHAKKTLVRVKAMQEVDPKNIGITIALNCLGPVYAELDEASLEEAEKALEIAKHNSGDHYFQYTRMVAQLGRVKQLRRKTTEAWDILEDLKKQTKLYNYHIGCRDLYDYLGRVYYELGEYKESLEAFKMCQRIVTHYYRHYLQHRDVVYINEQVAKVAKLCSTGKI